MEARATAAAEMAVADVEAAVEMDEADNCKSIIAPEPACILSFSQGHKWEGSILCRC